MKVLLIHPPLTGKERYGDLADAGAYWPPLGICYIAAVLEKAGHEVKIIDGLNLNITSEEIVKKVEDYNPDLVGLTSVTVAHHRTIELAELIKDKFSELMIVVGGPHVTFSPEKTMEKKCFDVGVFGEGEYTILDIIDCIKGEKSLAEVKGIIYRDGEDVKKNVARPFIVNLDELPLPARHLLDMEIYHTHILAHKRERAASIITSRGCPFSCVFCNRMFGKKYRGHSAEYVVKEIDELVKRYGIQELEIKDDNFTANPARVKKICKMLIERKYDLIWSCEARADVASEELFRMMKKAGCWLIQLGIETGDDRVMKAIKKGITVDQVEKAVKMANKAGIKVKGFFMLGHHVDTKESIEKTINFANSLGLQAANFTITVPMEGSELYTIMKDYGTWDGNMKELSVHTENPPFVPFGLTKEYLVDARRRAYLKFYTNPKTIFNLIKDVNSIYDFKRYYIGAKIYSKLMWGNIKSKWRT